MPPPSFSKLKVLPPCFSELPTGLTAPLLGGQGVHLPTQFFGNLRNEKKVGTTGWEKSTKLQNSVFLFRAGRGGCAGCAQAHPMFCSSLSKTKDSPEKFEVR